MGDQSYRNTGAPSALDSNRGSKSLSPRKYQAIAQQSSVTTMKASGVTVNMAPGLNMEDLRSKYNQVIEENKALKREI